jgi:hypothetical protein
MVIMEEVKDGIHTLKLEFDMSYKEKFNVSRCLYLILLQILHPWIYVPKVLEIIKGLFLVVFRQGVNALHS